METDKEVSRSEEDVILDLQQLAQSKGYIQALAYFVFWESAVFFSETLKPENLDHLFDKNRLIKSELLLLLGFLVQDDIATDLPDPDTMQSYIDKTKKLLHELHLILAEPLIVHKENSAMDKQDEQIGERLRESIFYGIESAYSFQYRDFAVKRYAEDRDWILENCGFDIADVACLIQTMDLIREKKANDLLEELKDQHPDDWSYVSVFSYRKSELISQSGLPDETVSRILDFFSVSGTEENNQFRNIADFNIINAKPLLNVEGQYLLFTPFVLNEALYDSPFYWMMADKKQKSKAAANRGKFTEDLIKERLESVFGADNVYLNVDIFKTKGEKVGEIDVLVLFAGRAIIIQAKSKKLTLKARSGNSDFIRDDFRKSILDSYDQAFLCARELVQNTSVFKTQQGKAISIPDSLQAVYPICAVSDHYPALFFQVRELLTVKLDNIIKAPLVIDVFALDTIVEMLASPLRLIQYIEKRGKYGNQLIASHENVILSYHIQTNLYAEDSKVMIAISDNISSDLDVAMIARRQGVSGCRTPEGILTRYNGSTLENVIFQLERIASASSVTLGLVLLDAGEKSFNNINNGLEQLAVRCAIDNKQHDANFILDYGRAGVTVHYSDYADSVARPNLHFHCEKRKYIEKMDQWFGICISPTMECVRFVFELSSKLNYSSNLEAQTSGMKSYKMLSTRTIDLNQSLPKVAKVGRNESCPCGSGLKYKKCCLR